MTLQDDVKTLLTADTGLVAAFTGGIVTWDQTGGLGINRNSYPTAFDSNLQLKPTIVIRERAIITEAAITDEITQHTSASQSVDIHFLQDRRNGWTTLETGQMTVFSLLQFKSVGGRHCRLRSHMRMERDRGYDNTCILWSVYDTFTVLG